MTQVDAAAVTALVRQVAAEVITPRFRALARHEVFTKGPGDLVTIADHESEALLIEGLGLLDPQAPVLGEEGAVRRPFARVAGPGRRALLGGGSRRRDVQLRVGPPGLGRDGRVRRVRPGRRRLDLATGARPDVRRRAGCGCHAERRTPRAPRRRSRRRAATARVRAAALLRPRHRGSGQRPRRGRGDPARPRPCGRLRDLRDARGGRARLRAVRQGQAVGPPAGTAACSKRQEGRCVASTGRRTSPPPPAWACSP